MSQLIKTLLKEKLITNEQLNVLISQRKATGKPVAELLVDLGFVSEREVISKLSKIMDIPVLHLEKDTVDTSALQFLSYETARRYGVFPVRMEENVLVVAVSNPLDFIGLDSIKFTTAMQVKTVLSTRKDIERAIDKFYQQVTGSISKLLEEDEGSVRIEKDEFEDKVYGWGIGRADAGAESSAAVKLADFILSNAVQMRATDIHVEPQERYVDIRYRIDGVMRSIMKVPNKFRNSLVSRIKILTDLDIAETKKTQDGRARIVVGKRKIDLRISIIPTFFGEKAALRLLDTQEARVELVKIGLKGSELNIFIEAISQPQGIILVTGPTSSGKTSTLYAALNFIRKSEVKNIITIEDPIEYLIEGVNQMQVNPAKEITFANGLRSILRQDPNVILVGEIRDRETADLAFRSSLTGHLVLSTLHTNSSVATINRLLNIGLESYLIASSLSLVIAQRLVRLICPNCKEKYNPSKLSMNRFKDYVEKFNIKTFYRGNGCDDCDGTGFLGRMAIFEMLKVSERVRYLIARKAPEDIIYREALRDGLRSLVESGIEKIAEGLTTLEEVSRVVYTTQSHDTLDKSGTDSQLANDVTEEDDSFLKNLEKRLFNDL